MLRLITAAFLTLILAACQHVNTTGTAYRIDRVIVEPSAHEGGATIAAQLRASLQAVADDINTQIPASAPSGDLIVRVESARYVAPNGPFMLGRSRLKGTIMGTGALAGETYRFTASDSGRPDLGNAFNLSGYYSLRASFGRIANKIAAEYSRRYAARHGTRALRRGDVTRRAHVSGTAAPIGPHQIPPPPLVVVAQ